jgi:hypothetical protein
MIRERPQIISGERMPGRTGMPSHEGLAEIGSNTVKVAVLQGSKKSRDGANYEYSI